MSKIFRKDNPWIFRTYAGHSNARESNQHFKKNLAKGQTGLSIAFDLPTQMGYDSDHELAQGEVGKVGVPICHIGDMELLFEGISLEQMNTSMTINATAAWLLALYVALCERRGGRPEDLKGTTQNDILKEYLSRGTYVFPPQPSLKLTTDVIAYTCQHIPKWNPVNICPYHLQEAGATPVQELAYGLANAVAILDDVRKSNQVPEADFPKVVGRISFFLDAGIRFVEEMCKTRAFAGMWDDLCLNRYGVQDKNFRRFRYGVQVNSLGLTEVQPENNIIRIIYELLGVTLSKDGRARAVQLPAWNEAFGLPRPWDQQWSLRVQQILAHETDLLEYGDLFEGSAVVEKKVSELVAQAQAELNAVQKMGGALRVIESGYIKSQLVQSSARRLKAIEEGVQKVVGVNCYQDAEPSPLAVEESILNPSEAAVREQQERLKVFKARRDQSAVQSALKNLTDVIKHGGNVMEPSIHCAHAGVTTGEWAAVLREVFGEYRAPTGVSGVSVASTSEAAQKLRERVREVEKAVGRKIRILVGKPGLDGHSNGAEQIALKARDAGMEVIYQGIRLTPEQIVSSAVQEDVDVIGLSILSGSHVYLVKRILDLAKKHGVQNIPLVVGGIIPRKDQKELIALGVKKIYTPGDYELNAIMLDIAELVLAAAQ